MRRCNWFQVLAASSLQLGSFVLGGCSPDNRLAKDAAATILATTLRDQGVRGADGVAKACLDLEWALPQAGMQDVAGAQRSWTQARLSYDRSATMFKLLAPELDALIDGELDSPLTRVGLRKLEQPLFAKPIADGQTLSQGARALAEAAVRLPPAVADPSRSIDVGAFFGTLSALVVVTGVKLDGSDSPFANQSLVSVRVGLQGIAELYAPMSSLIHDADPALDEQIQRLLSELLGQLQGVSATEQVRDKVLFLRRSAELGQALLAVGPALGLTISVVVDVT